MGTLMRTVILLAIVLVFAGTAHAQFGGGSINVDSSIGQGRGINTHHAPLLLGPGPANPDATVNLYSKNPEGFVPSTFTTFKDGLTTARLQAAARPISVAEAARLERERRSKSHDTNVVQLDEDAQGRLEIAPAQK